MAAAGTHRLRGVGLRFGQPNANGDVFMPGAFDASKIRGVKADMLIIDEVQDMPRYSGCHIHEADDGELYLSNYRDPFTINFIAKETIGVAIGNTAAISRTNFV